MSAVYGADFYPLLQRVKSRTHCYLQTDNRGLLQMVNKVKNCASCLMVDGVTFTTNNHLVSSIVSDGLKASEEKFKKTGISQY